MKKIEGNIVDIHERKIYPGVIILEGGKIVSIDKNSMHYSHYITPGLVDAHVHIESSMLTPFEFSKLVIRKGTVAVVTDPHEIANVLGKSGIDFMVEDSHYSFVKTFFTIPSCVPSTPFDFSGEFHIDRLTVAVNRALPPAEQFFVNRNYDLPDVSLLKGTPERILKRRPRISVPAGMKFGSSGKGRAGLILEGKVHISVGENQRENLRPTPIQKPGRAGKRRQNSSQFPVEPVRAADDAVFRQKKILVESLSPPLVLHIVYQTISVDPDCRNHSDGIPQVNPRVRNIHLLRKAAFARPGKLQIEKEILSPVLFDSDALLGKLRLHGICDTEESENQAERKRQCKYSHGNFLIT